MGEIKLKKKIIFLLMSICFLMTSINVYADDSSDDLQEVQVEYDEDFLWLQTLGMDSAKWSIKNNTEKTGRSFACKKNQKVRFNLNLSTIKNVSVGIKDSTGNKYYVETQKSITNSITVKKTDTYRVFIKNKSGKSITVSGYYSYN